MAIPTEAMVLNHIASYARITESSFLAKASAADPPVRSFPFWFNQSLFAHCQNQSQPTRDAWVKCGNPASNAGNSLRSYISTLCEGSITQKISTGPQDFNEWLISNQLITFNNLNGSKYMGKTVLCIVAWVASHLILFLRKQYVYHKLGFFWFVFLSLLA